MDGSTTRPSCTTRAPVRGPRPGACTVLVAANSDPLARWLGAGGRRGLGGWCDKFHRRAVRPDQRDLDRHRGHARARLRSYRHAAPRWQGAVVGGQGNPRLAELYEPASRTWTATALPKIRVHVDHAATLLRDGRVLVTGGPPNGNDVGPRPSCMTRAADRGPSPGAWSGSALGHTRDAPAGWHGARGGRPTLAAMIAPRPSCTTPPAGPGPPPRAWARSGAPTPATLLLDGRVLVTGGFRSDGNGVLASAEVYDPDTGTWTAAPKMDTPLANQTATLLPDGRVLVAGGMSVIDGTARPLASAELYDPGIGN